jgi:hypothetical protein
MNIGLLTLPSSPSYAPIVTTLLICRRLVGMATKGSEVDIEAATAVGTGSWGALALLIPLLPHNSLYSSIQIRFAGCHELCTPESIP